MMKIITCVFLVCAFPSIMGCVDQKDAKLKDIDWIFSDGSKYLLMFEGVVYEYTNKNWGEDHRNKDILREKGRQGGFFDEQDEKMIEDGKAYILSKNTKIRVESVKKHNTITNSFLLIKFEITDGKSKGKFVTLDTGWSKCRGDYLDEKVAKNPQLKGLTFHYPDPKYFKPL